VRQIGGYQLIEQIGQGATAEVFVGKSLDSPASLRVLKIFRSELWQDPKFRIRANEEYVKLSEIQHPNILKVIDFINTPQNGAFVMEHIPGTVSLESYQTRLPYVLPEISVLIAIEILDALAESHKRGVIHRDIKPANVLLTPAGQVLVTDFGHARFGEGSGLTLTGTLLGSPDFMSPEQARGEKIEPTSDLFSLGSLVYFLVTGTRPFQRNHALLTLKAVSDSTAEPVSARNPKVSKHLESLIRKAMNKNPSQRFQNALEAKNAFSAYLAECGIQSSGLHLKLWFDQGSSATFEFLQTIANHRELLAEQSLAEGQENKVWEHLSHLAMVSPEHPAIQRITLAVASMPRQNPHTIVGLSQSWILALASFAAFAVLLYWIATPHLSDALDERIAKNADIAETVTNTSKTLPIQELPKISKPASAGVTETEPLPKPALKVAPRKTLAGLSLQSIKFDLPSDVVVFWNHRQIDHTKGLNKVYPGDYQLRLVKPGSPPIEQVIPVRNEPVVIRAR